MDLTIYALWCFPGIDIDAGCGQLKAELIRRKKPTVSSAPASAAAATESKVEDKLSSDALAACTNSSPRTAPAGAILQDSIAGSI
jgi:hypothetical protein